MLVELILAACTESGLHFPHAECGSGYVWVFYYEVNQSIVLSTN